MPVKIDRFEEVDASVLDEYPQPLAPGKKVDLAWEELLTKLDQGRVIRVPLGEESGMRGLRLALGRRAIGRQTLVVRKSDQPLTARIQPATTPPENGRRKRARPARTAAGLGTEGEGGEL